MVPQSIRSRYVVLPTFNSQALKHPPHRINPEQRRADPLARNWLTQQSELPINYTEASRREPNAYVPDEIVQCLIRDTVVTMRCLRGPGRACWHN